jgi:bifunctional DNA-binding transcriptional regulator/antitoxin component of YhaV-PrlF toxin-antitoxin module
MNSMMNPALRNSLPGRISKGGQISIPASIRHRWATDRVLLEDRGDVILVRPVPADPIAAVRGRFRGLGGPSSDEMRALAREEDAQVEAERERVR